MNRHIAGKLTRGSCLDEGQDARFVSIPEKGLEREAVVTTCKGAGMTIV